MFTFTIATKLQNHAVCVNCVHPASQMNTKMVVEAGRVPKSTVSEGVENVLYVVANAETENICGVFFNGRHPDEADMQAYDDEAKEKLYRLSSELVGL